MNKQLQTPATKHAYLYSRVSRGAQAKGAGLTRQDERGVAICKEKGWTLVSDFTLQDVGKSAYTGSNILKGDLGKFIRAAEDGLLKPNPILILEQWDRFSRQDLDTSFEQARNLLKLGVDIHIGFSGGKTFTKADLNDQGSRIGMEISMQQAWEYSHNLSKRVNDAFARKYALASEGKAVQLGYWQPAWIDFIGEKKQVGTFELNKVAPIIKGIADDYLSGKSMLAIANQLNRDKVPCIGRGKKQGKRWSQGQVAYLLKSPSLVGTIEINGHTFSHYYPRVIEDAEWIRLQSLLTDNKTKKGGTRDGEHIANLFANRVKCAKCGGSISTHQGKVKSGIQRYYKCQEARLNKGKCQCRTMLPTYRIEEDFFLLFLKQHPAELLGKNTAEHQTTLARVNASIKEVEKDQEQAAELLGKYPSQALDKKFATLQARMNALLKEREEGTKIMTASNNAPSAFVNIKRALGSITNEVAEFDVAANQVIASLKDNDTRRKLLSLIPSLVECLTVDLELGLYSITTKDGKTTPMRDVIELPTL